MGNFIKETREYLNKLNDREQYLRELQAQIESERTRVRIECPHDIIVYFGQESATNQVALGTRTAECLCCGRRWSFKKDSKDLDEFLKQGNILNITKIIDVYENPLACFSTFYKDTLNKARINVEEFMVFNDGYGISELFEIVESTFTDEQSKWIEKYNQVSRKTK